MRYSKTGRLAAERVRLFGERFVVHKKDRWAGLPFVLEPWQWEHIILPVYGNVARDGTRRVTQALIGLPRWSGKSELVSLMVMYHLFAERVQEGEAYVVASNERQAGIVFNTVKRMIQANPRLSAACDIYKREIWVKETGCVFKALPADADSAQGFHPSFVAVDEVHVHRNHDLIEAMQSGMVARHNPLLVAITTAGPKREGVLWDMLHGNEAEGRVPWSAQAGTYVYWIGATDRDRADDPRVWRRCNPASWITEDMLAQQFEKLPLRAFERYHLNRFPLTADAHHAFTPAEIQTAARQRSAFDFEEPFVVGIDGAQSGDAFAIICAQAREDGMHFAEYVFDDPSSTEDGFYDLTQIEQLIAELYAAHRAVAYIDPARLLLMAQHLEHTYNVPVVAVRQDDKTMCPATSLVVNAVKTGKAHIGGCPKLTAHLANALLDEKPAYGERFTSTGKGKSKARIDAAIAAAIALYALETQTARPPSFAESGGIWTIKL